MPLPRRFDDALLRPPDATADSDPAVAQRIRAWCEAGAFTAPMLPVSAASIDTAAGLDGVASELDGAHALARLPRWRGLAWRLQLQLRERLPGHRARPTDPWDCGWWRARGLDAALAFRPRRPTLLMVHELHAAEARVLLAALQSQSSTYQRPMRLLFASQSPLPDLPRL